jgi:pimeloyl-ACP methyl ester carboxylesterase
MLRRTLNSSQLEPSSRPELAFDGTQQIRFCYTADKTRLAYAEVGTGPPLVKAANWLTHLDYDWDTQSFSLEHWVEDLETVVDAAGLGRFPLLGISQGAAVAVTFAARHPERVSCLVLYGGYVFGRMKRGRTDDEKRSAALLPQLAELGWGTDDPSFRQVFTARFMPDGTAEQWRAFSELLRRTTSPTNAAAFLRAFGAIDVTDEAPRVTAPTLILHARGDMVPPIDQGRQLAALIPDSRFVTLDSKNHLLLEHEPAWTRFLVEVERFLHEHEA